VRIRKKRNLPERLDRCAHLREETPERLRGAWLREREGCRELHAELGCGKGKFTVDMAASHPQILFAAIERVADAQITAMERAAAAGLCNIRFITRDARDITDFFDRGELSRIYINFCDPWSGTRRAKRRLTAPGFLEMYLNVLRPGGEIHFRTDNVPLFEYSLEQFSLHGFQVPESTRDLHGDGEAGEAGGTGGTGGSAEDARAFATDYEEKFIAQGIKICRCVAIRE
jgi:tRNA (guanine-N7-)-methyltransferase